MHYIKKKQRIWSVVAWVSFMVNSPGFFMCCKKRELMNLIKKYIWFTLFLFKDIATKKKNII